MRNKKFEVKEWERHCKLFDKNREGLHITPRFEMTDGKMKLSLPNVEKKYVSPLQKLAKVCIEGAVCYMTYQFTPFYASDNDYEEEYKKNMNALENNLEYYLNIFFTKGFNSFLEAVEREVSFYYIRYNLNQASFQKGIWLSTDGSTWNGKAWEKDGQESFNMITQAVWTQIFNAL